MFMGDDGRFYSSEAEWEWAYNEGCKEEMRRILEAEAADEFAGDDEEDDFIGPRRPYLPERDDIPF